MSTLNNEKQKDPVEDAINALKNILNTIADILSKMNLDELVQLYSKKIDAEILKTVKETGWVYRGGQFTVTYVTKETLSLEIALYYQNKEGEWIQVKSVTPREMKCLKEAAVQELFEKKKIAYDIDAPKEEKPKVQGTIQ